MKTLISILLVTLAGCASKPQPVEWCKQYDFYLAASVATANGEWRKFVKEM